MVASECKICQASANGSYYGCVACKPCKVFFKRNAETTNISRCSYDDQCDININNRHVCPSCRLKKCFAAGMQTDRIRGTYPKLNKNKSRASKSNATVPTSAIVPRRSEKLSTLNLLNSDQSTLTVDQWNHLSNLLNCYDEHSGLMIGRNYISEQNNLPIKLRLKPTSVIQLIQSLLTQANLVYQKNQDFLSLSSNDCSILLDCTISYITSSSASLIHTEVGLNDLPVFHEVIDTICSPGCASINQRIAERIISDAVIMKLFLAIMSFSTLRYTSDPSDLTKNFVHVQDIIRIQDEYTELVWRYLVYTYKFERAVKCFSDLVRFQLVIIEGIERTKEIVWFTDTVHTMTQQTKDILTF